MKKRKFFLLSTVCLLSSLIMKASFAYVDICPSVADIRNDNLRGWKIDLPIDNKLIQNLKKSTHAAMWFGAYWYIDGRGECGYDSVTGNTLILWKNNLPKPTGGDWKDMLGGGDWCGRPTTGTHNPENCTW